MPSKLTRGLPLPKDDGGWLKVTDRLHSPEDESIYGVGDQISIVGEKGSVPVPRLAHHALDQASVASLNIHSHMRGSRGIAYVPKSKPQLVSIGENMGILAQGGCVYSGRSVVLLKKIIRMRHLMAYLTKPAVSALSDMLPGKELRLLMRWLSPL